MASAISGGSGDLQSLSITNLAARNKWVGNFLWSGDISSMPRFRGARDGENCIGRPVTWRKIENILDQNLASLPHVHNMLKMVPDCERFLQHKEGVEGSNLANLYGVKYHLCVRVAKD